MNTEIERKFLVVGDAWRACADEGLACEQGYIATAGGATVRARLIGGKGVLTLKGRTVGISRAELEYEIPAEEATYMLRNFCGERTVSKRRYLYRVEGICWEIDVFDGANAGLVLAEIELDDEAQTFNRPAWLGEEVSSDPRYYNSSLSMNPYSGWDESGQ